MEERIQKIIAQAGKASRRKAEELILEGRVTVNGKPATIGMKADIHKDHIKVDGKLLTRPEQKVYFMLNKPKGVVTTLHDPEGRTTIVHYLKGVKHRVFPVGRLDYDSEGLLLLTNDGEFSHALTHPSKKVSKTYYIKVKGAVESDALKKIKTGIRLEEGMTLPAKARILEETAQNTWLEITIYEGKKRQIRRMLEKVGSPVLKLKRVSIDGLKIGDLKSGELRPLTQAELENIKKAVNK